MSVWCVHGNPEAEGGMHGALRDSLMLLPVTAEIPVARARFLQMCCEQDGVSYTGSKIDAIRYVGWVWLPEKEDPSWTIPSMLGHMETIIDELKNAAPASGTGGTAA